MNSKFAKYIPIIVTVAGTLGAAVFTPHFLAAHPMVAAGAAITVQIIHAALPSIASPN